jgi:protein-arginine kinase activator protein McsA
MTEAEQIAAFKQANTFECIALRAQITLLQCSKNQKREMFVCQDCKQKDGSLIPQPLDKQSGWKRLNLLNKQYPEKMAKPLQIKERERKVGRKCEVENCGKYTIKDRRCYTHFQEKHGKPPYPYKSKEKTTKKPETEEREREREREEPGAGQRRKEWARGFT